MGSQRVGHDRATSLSLFTFHFHALEKEMATHSSVLSWRTPGTAEPGGVTQSRTRLERLSSSSSSLIKLNLTFKEGLPRGSAANVGETRDSGSVPGSGRAPGEGNGNPLQCSCLENSMGRGAWRATGHSVAKSWTRLSDFTFFLSIVPFGEGNGNPLQCSCLENPVDGGAWWATVYGVSGSWT